MGETQGRGVCAMRGTADSVTRRVAALLALLLLAPAAVTWADPWAETGDVRLRHDLELLSDAGALDLMTMTWPLNWGDVGRAVARLDEKPLSEAQRAALRRVRLQMRRETTWGWAESTSRVAAAETPIVLRSFDDTPRTNAEAGASIGFTGERFAGKLSVTLTVNPSDKRNARMDGSYVAAVWGNVALTLGLQDRWWGPGWDGSLILSNNARPVPGVSLARVYTDPSELPILRWLGPFSYTIIAGKLESSRAVSDAKLLGARFVFRPLRSLELAVSRTAQWGGEGRPQDLQNLFDLILGRDNIGDAGVTADNEPGNQLAGFDWRWRTGPQGLPIVLYGQLIGEDEAGGFPSRYLGLLGVSVAGDWHNSAVSWRLRLEYSDTTCSFTESSADNFDCAYRNAIYTDGYRYHGRSIGHSTDNDARQIVLGATLVDSADRLWSAQIRSAQLNRGGRRDSGNFVAQLPADFVGATLSHTRDLWGGDLEAGVGYQDIDREVGTDGKDVQLYFQWRIQN